MTKKLNWLSGLLALQLIIAVGLFIGSRPESTMSQVQPLLSFQPDRVDRVRVSDGDQQVTLVREGARWRLPDLQALPADGKQLDSVLDKLVELKTTWPVTTSKSSHGRLHVAADEFNRRISLYAGDQLLDELFLGTSPGFKQVYSRAAQDDNVYPLALNTYEFPVNAFDWLDKGLLAVKNARRIQEKDLKLVRSGGEWQLEEASSDSSRLQAPVQLDSDKVTQITDVLGGMQVTGVAGKAPDFSAPEAVSLDVSGDSDWTYHLVESEGQYYVKRDDIDAVFTIGQQAFNTLSAIERKDLVASNGNDTPAPQETGEAPAEAPAPSEAGG